MTGSADATPLPPVLAAQVRLIRDQFAAEGAATPEGLRRFVDAAVLNICEHVDVEMALLNRVLAVRAAVEGLALAIEEPEPDAAFTAACWTRAREELAAFETALLQARPSAITVALGLGW